MSIRTIPPPAAAKPAYVPSPPLTRVQQEMLFQFAIELPQEQLATIRGEISKYMLDRLRAALAGSFENYTDEDYDRLLYSPEQ